MGKWLKLSEVPSNKTLQSIDFGEVAESDVEGAVAGAVGAMITGCGEATLGTCAGIGATAGAAGASLAKAVVLVLFSESN